MYILAFCVSTKLDVVLYFVGFVVYRRKEMRKDQQSELKEFIEKKPPFGDRNNSGNLCKQKCLYYKLK